MTDETPDGTLMILFPDGRAQALLNARYTLAEGDLILVNSRGKSISLPAGSWLAVGTLKREGGQPYFALEAAA